ncbi:MAG TPA: hypothetical protein VD866_14380 [Urbifossiella sp.]|nr:hypothetical protein [Urbifossiella sp.]
MSTITLSTPSPASSLKPTATVALGSLLMVAAVGLAVWVQQPWTVVLPVAVVVLYALLALAEERHDHDTVAAIAVRVHLLGFLAAFAAVGFLALLIPESGALRGAAALRVVADGIWATLTGVLLALVIRTYASSLPAGPVATAVHTAGAAGAAELAAIREELRQCVAAAFAVLRDTVGESAALVRKYSEEIKGLDRAYLGLGTTVGRFGQQLQLAGAQADDFREQVASMKRAVSEFEQVLEDFERLYEARLDERILPEGVS